MEQAGTVIGILGGILGSVGVLLSIFFGITAYRRTSRQDIASGASVEAALRIDIDYIKQGIDDIKMEQRRMHEDTGRLSERVTRVEESVKSAHKRLDELVIGRNDAESKPCDSK